jgi:hypothetical protein
LSGSDRDPTALRRRARQCRAESRTTDHDGLSAALADLATALELAASVIDMARQGLLN